MEILLAFGAKMAPKLVQEGRRVRFWMNFGRLWRPKVWFWNGVHEALPEPSMRVQDSFGETRKNKNGEIFRNTCKRCGIVETSVSSFRSVLVQVPESGTWSQVELLYMKLAQVCIEG